MEAFRTRSDLDWVVEVLADRTRRGIYLWVKQARGPVSVNEVADAFSMHRNAVKFHLDKLLDAGLLHAEFRRINGRKGPGAGRPSKLYSATGIEVMVSVPERRYELLAQLLLRSLTTGSSLEEVGYDFGRQLAEDMLGADGECGCEPLRCAESAMRELGFEPTVDVDADGRTWITTENCPFGCVATQAPDMEVCRLDHAIIRGLMETVSDGDIKVREKMSIPQGHQVCVREVSFGA